MKKRLQNINSKQQKKRKLQNTINKQQNKEKNLSCKEFIAEKSTAILVILCLLIIWQLISMSGVVPRFMLPSPIDVVKAFISDFPLLMEHTKVTLLEAFLGLLCGVIIAFIAAVCMDRFPRVYKGVYPIIVLTQTIPTIAIAPLLVLWMGYEMAPKIVLIVITTFFPITIGLLNGFRSVDKDAVDLMKAMGASRIQIFRYMKLPGSLGHFFSGLRVSAAYSIVGAVIAEWLGGYHGLGVYMVRVKKSYAFDKMFAVIFLVSIVSLLLMWLVDVVQRAVMPWERMEEKS